MGNGQPTNERANHTWTPAIHPSVEHTTSQVCLIEIKSSLSIAVFGRKGPENTQTHTANNTGPGNSLPFSLGSLARIFPSSSSSSNYFVLSLWLEVWLQRLCLRLVQALVQYGSLGLFIRRHSLRVGCSKMIVCALFQTRNLVHGDDGKQLELLEFGGGQFMNVPYIYWLWYLHMVSTTSSSKQWEDHYFDGPYWLIVGKWKCCCCMHWLGVLLVSMFACVDSVC